MKKDISRSWIRRIFLFVLVFSMFFGTVLAPGAEAASKYKVHSWKTEYQYCYYIYKGKLPKNYEPHFVRYSFDQYKSGKMKINFYFQTGEFGAVNDEMADAFLKKLGQNSKGKYSYKYTYYDNVYFPRIVFGWYYKEDSVTKLIRKSPFTNDQGYKLYIVKLGDGDITAKYKLDFDSNEYPEYSWAEYIKKDNITIGYQFVDKDGYIADMHGEYFPWW